MNSHKVMKQRSFYLHMLPLVCVAGAAEYAMSVYVAP